MATSERRPDRKNGSDRAVARRSPGRSSTTITIHDVAKAAGVATSTVSRALNGDGRVSEATRHRVSQIAQDMGYSPSRFARALRLSKTTTLGFIAPDFANPVTLSHLRAAVRTAHQEGYAIFVSDSQGDPAILESQIRRFVEHRVDGILFGRGVLLLTPGADELLANSGIPLEPELPPRTPDDPEIRAYNPYRERADIERGASMVAFKHLLDLGHRRIAYFSRPRIQRTYVGDTRLASLREATVKAGLPEDAIIEIQDTSEEQCVGEVQQLAGMADPPTAIVCANGVLTTGVLRGIYQAGWRVPEDISLLVFGDSVWHESHQPPLAVIRHDYTAAAERSLYRLVARAEGHDNIPDPARRPAEFLPRGSLAAPRRDA